MGDPIEAPRPSSGRRRSMVGGRVAVTAIVLVGIVVVITANLWRGASVGGDPGSSADVTSAAGREPSSESTGSGPSASPSGSEPAPSASDEATPAPSAPPVTITYQESSSLIAYRGSWAVASHQGYLGTNARWTSAEGASVRLSFVGHTVSWIGPLGPTRGKARVSIDGVYQKTVDEYAQRFTASRTLFRATFDTDAPRTIEIVAVGTAGHPVVAVDAFVVRSGGLAPTTSPTPTTTTSPTPTTSSGQTFYLAPNGSDAADGSLGAPRRTILGGSRLLGPGDTLLVRGGTYHDPGGYDWATSASGTSSAPITVRAYPGETPVFDGGATGPSSGYDGHPQVGLIVKDVAWVTFDGLMFTHFDPYDNGIVLVVGADHITFTGLRSLANYSEHDTEHDVYIAHSSNVLIDGATLDGIAGAGVHIYDSGYAVGSKAVGSSNVTVRNSHITGSGHWGIAAGTGLAGGSFSGNTISGRDIGIEFLTPTTNVVVTGNTIGGPIGIQTNLIAYGGYGPADEMNDCLDSPVPFSVGWPARPWTLGQWQATGRGDGTTVGACP